MKLKLIVFFAFFLVNNFVAQNESIYETLNDLVITNAQEEEQIQTINYISKINLEGHYKILVVAVGFSDVLSTQNWPQIYPASEYYPYQGSLSDSTTLNNYLLQNDSINIEDWYGVGFELFFDLQSNGEFTVESIYPKPPNGYRYMPSLPLSNWGSGDNIIWDHAMSIANYVSKEMVEDNANIFDDIDMVQFIFDGLPKNKFHVKHGGFTWEANQTIYDPANSSNVYFSGPVAFNKNASSLVHEFCHKMGSIAGSPSGFSGLPDRGISHKYPSYDMVDEGHYNTTVGYDIMFHSGHFPSLYSLYGLVPLNSHDLIFFDWIKDDEIKVINEGESLSGIKLADMTLPLTETQKNDNFYRIIKVMINENYSGDQDEYFLLEYHKGTNFDRQYHNHDELPYNEGVLVWHIKERDAFGISNDDFIDLELAVPYNGWNGNPIPDNGYVGTYNYDRIGIGYLGFWNGNFAGDFDWLDCPGSAENGLLFNLILYNHLQNYV